MLQQATIGGRILEVVRANPDCTLEEVTQQLPDLYWSDVFLEVEILRRLGQLRLTQSSLGLTTTICVP
ncbi:MAG: hypothetical protein KGS09_19565 [Nitrospirae bacterium]|nr:hypothetical protein [Nitrospirota bacterium]MBU6482726.1 hypothetical protein [Nitrospirota bacterium]MDE3050593.1 hypothetical protein [Nitrospirota bacterium]MDE3221132.1 hypothetical protein [Nitrospirota bacterium]